MSLAVSIVWKKKRPNKIVVSSDIFCCAYKDHKRVTVSGEEGWKEDTSHVNDPPVHLVACVRVLSRVLDVFFI